MDLRWRADPRNPDGDGSLFDEDVRVGHVHYLKHGVPISQPNRDHRWNWSVFPYVWPRPQVTTTGRCATKEDAKAAAEAAYRQICDIPGARDQHMKHTRSLARRG